MIQSNIEFHIIIRIMMILISIILLVLPNPLDSFHPSMYYKKRCTSTNNEQYHRIFVNMNQIIPSSLSPSLTTSILFSSSSSSSSSSTRSLSIDDENTTGSAIQQMTIQELKTELKLRDISIKDVFEKDELIRRLLLARQQQQTTPDNDLNLASTSSTTPTSRSNININNNNNNNVISTPLFFTTMDQGVRIPSKGNNNYYNANGGINNNGIIIESSLQPYATMKIQIPNPKNNNQNNNSSYSILSLLVDTACTGFVLRPSTVQKYQLPLYNTPVTMQGAAGISQTTGLTQLSSFTLYNNDENHNNNNNIKFGPLPAAVQDIGGLPSILDGIIGLSFMNQFHTMEFNFQYGTIQFYKTENSISQYNHNNNNQYKMIVDTKLNRIDSLGIYTANVYFGTRGPIQMLIDTGASCTLLNWKGITDLGLSKTSKQVLNIPKPMGAMGSENIAIQLTHRLYVSSTIQIGDNSNNVLPGIQLNANNNTNTINTRIPIDIGSIPVIDNIPGGTVGGILGIDILMRCNLLRISTQGSIPKLTMFV